MARRFGWVACLVVVLAPLTCATAETQTDNEKAIKYYEVLAKRPRPGYLYDRFYNTWLDTGTLDSLRAFLEKQVAEKGRTADRLLLAFYHAKQGDDVQALQQFRTALAKDPDNAQAWYEKAVVEARTLDFDTAIGDLDKARGAEPDEKLTTAIAKMQGKLYVRNRQTDKALKTWKTLLDANPRDEDLYEDIIELQINEGLYEEAAALSQSLIDRTTDKYKQVIRRVRLGDIHQRAAARSKALEVYSATLKDVGHGTWLEREIVAQIEQLFRREDDLTGLQQQYEKLLVTYPQRIHIHKQFAKLLSELGEFDAATKRFEEILRLTPGDRTNAEAYVALLASTEKLPGAIKAMQTLIAQHPRDGELRLKLANLHHQAGDKAAAGAAVQQYLDVADESEYAYLRAARVLQQFELLDDAEEIHDQLVAAFPDSAAAHEARAAFLYDRDKQDEALAIWRKLAAGQERSQVVRVARILAARNEHQAAFDLLFDREADLAGDPIFLGQLVTEAIALKKFDEALPWTRRRVQLAKTAADLETAIGQAAQVAGKANKVEALIAQLKALPRQSVQQTCLLSELLERNGDRQGAENALSKVEDQQSLLVANQQIRLYTQRQDWTKAAEATRRLVQLPAGRKGVYVRRLVDLYQRDLQTDEALHWVQEWKKLSPGSNLPWLTESRLLSQQGKTDEAINALRAAAQEFDDDQDVRARLAQLYLDSGKLADAERIYWRLYDDGDKLNTKLRWVQKLAETTELQGKTQQLIERFEERKRTNRRSIEPLLALAEIHRHSSNYEERRSALLEATRIKGDDLQLLHQIARIEETEGDWERAMATLERAAKLDETTKTRELMARLHLNYGDTDQGYALLYELAGSQQADARGIEAIASAMMSVQDWERAAEFLAPQLTEHPDDYRLRYLYAIAQEEAGELTAATQAFLALLTADKEIPGLTGLQPPQTPWAGFMAPLASLMPPQTVDYMNLSWLNEVVYSYRYGGRSVARLYAPPTGQNVVLMPHNVEAARKYGLAHLLTISEELRNDEVADLTQAMADRGVSGAKILVEMAPEDALDAGAIQHLAEQYPDDVGVMGLYVLMNMFEGGRRGYDSELALKAYELFKDHRPQLGLMVALSIAQYDDEHEELLDAALKQAPAFENPNLFVVMSMAVALGGDYSGPEDTMLADKYRQPLTDLLVKWYPKMQNPGQQGDYIFRYVSSALSTSEDPADYFAFLDDEVVRWRNSGAHAQSSGGYGGGYYGGDEGLIAPLSFPPSVIPNFSPEVYSAAMDSRPDLVERLDSTLVTAALKAVNDPTLKLLLAYQFEADSLIKDTLIVQLQAEQPSLDAFLFAAAKVTEDEHYELAIALLDRARYLPMTREVRERVDAALVAMTLQVHPPGSAPDAVPTEFTRQVKAALSGDKSADDPDDEETSVLEIGQKAALRLRRTMLVADERFELIAAMEELGLEDEAQKLEDVAAAMPAGVGRSSYGGGSSQTDRVTRLLNDGKRDQALRLIAGELSDNARRELTNASSYGYSRYDAQELVNLVRSHGLVKETLAKVEVSKDANMQKLGAFAYACEVFDEKQKAREIYEAMLAKRAKDDAARFRLMLLLAETDAAAALAHFDKLDKRKLETFGESFVDYIGEKSLPSRQICELAAGINGVVKGLDDPDQHSLAWLDNLAQILSRGGMHSGSWGAPPWHGSSPREIEVLDDELKELRQKTHDEICRTMLKIPQLAFDGFQRLLHDAESDDRVTDEFVTMARNALLAVAQAEDSPYSSGYPGPTAFYSSYFGARVDDEHIPYRNPDEFLARHAWKTKNLALINADVVPALKKANQEEIAEQLQAYTSLYFCEEEKYVQTAKEYTEFAQEQFEYASGAMEKVLEVWQERQLKVDLGALLLEQRTAIVDEGLYSDHGHVVVYCTALVQRGGQAEFETFLQQLADVYLGPADEREELRKRNRRLRYAEREEALRDLIVSLGMTEELLFTVADFLADLELSEDPMVMARYLNQIHEYQDATRAINLFEASPFLKDLDELRLYPSTDSTALGLTLMRLRDYIQDEIREQIVAQLKERDPQTFGAELVTAYLEPAEDPFASKNALDVFVKHEKAIRALSEDKQQQLAILFDELVPRGAFGFEDIELSADDQRVQAWMASFHAGDREQMVKQILEAEASSDLEFSVANQYEQLQEVLADLVDADPVKALKLFDKLVQLTEQNRSRSVDISYYSEESLEQELLSAVISDDGEEVEMNRVAFVIDVLRREVEPPVILHSWTRHQLSYAASSLYEATEENVPDSAEQRGLKILQAFYQAVGKELGPRPATIVADACRDACAELSDEELASAIKWAEAEVEGGDYPAIAGELAAAANWVAALRRDAQQPYAYPHFVSIMVDKEHPVAWRVSVLQMITDLSTRATLSPPLSAKATLACADLLTEALASDIDLESADAVAIYGMLAALRPDEAWKNTVDALTAAWNKRNLRSGSSGGYYGYGPVDSEAVLMLKLNLLNDDEQAVARLMRNFGASLGNDQPTFALLVRHGRNARAAKIVRDSWHVMLMRAAETGISSYDKQLHEAIPKFLETLVRDDLRYLAEVILATLPDELDEEGKPPVSLDERMKRVAGKFNDAPFASPAMREQAMAWLCTNHAAAKLIAEPIAEAARNIDLTAATQLEDSHLMDRKTAIVASYLRTTLADGQIQPLADALDGALKGVKDAGADYFFGRSVVEVLYSIVQEEVPDVWSTWTPQQLAEFTTVTRQLVELGAGYYYMADGVFVLNVLAHAHANLLDEHETWWNGLDEEVQDEFLVQWGANGIWSAALQPFGEASEENLSDRIELTARVIRIGESQGWLDWDFDNFYIGHRDSFAHQIVSADLFGEEEFLEHGAKVAKAAEAGGLAWAALANYQEARDADEAAAASWAKAVAAAPKDNAHRQTDWRIRQAAALHKLSRSEEARAVLNNFDRSLMHEPSREVFEELQEKLDSQRDQPE